MKLGFTSMTRDGIQLARVEGPDGFQCMAIQGDFQAFQLANFSVI